MNGVSWLDMVGGGWCAMWLLLIAFLVTKNLYVPTYQLQGENDIGLVGLNIYLFASNFAVTS